METCTFLAKKPLLWIIDKNINILLLQHKKIKRDLHQTPYTITTCKPGGTTVWIHPKLTQQRISGRIIDPIGRWSGVKQELNPTSK
jgi:hypothetical protein